MSSLVVNEWIFDSIYLKIKTCISHKESANNLLVLPEEVFGDGDKKDPTETDEQAEDEDNEEDLDQPVTLKTLFHSILKVKKKFFLIIFF